MESYVSETEVKGSSAFQQSFTQANAIVAESALWETTPRVVIYEAKSVKRVKVGGHPERYWRAGLPFSVENEAQPEELWNAMSREFAGELAMMVFPRKWNRASGRELHFRLNKEDNDNYIGLTREVGTLVMAYLSSGKTERRILRSVANEILHPES